MSKRNVNCVVCGGKLEVQTIQVTEDEDGGADIEQMDGFVCADCGIHYKNLPKAKVVKQKQWESRVIDEMGGS